MRCREIRLITQRECDLTATGFSMSLDSLVSVTGDGVWARPGGSRMRPCQEQHGDICPFDQARAAASPCEPLHYVDQLLVGCACWIAKFSDRMRVGEIAQPNEFADPLPPVQLQLGPPVGEQDARNSPSSNR